MACDRWNDEWVGRLYGEIDPQTDRELATHLESCSECRTTMERLAEVSEAVRSAAPAVPTPPRILVASSPSPRWPGLAFAAGLACATIVFALGVGLGRWTAPVRTVTMPNPATASTDRHAEPPWVELGRTIGEVQARLDRIEGAAEPERPAGIDAPHVLTRRDLEGELTALQRRVELERAKDLEYVFRTMTASEARTGIWMDQTNEALRYLAVGQDQRLSPF